VTAARLFGDWQLGAPVGSLAAAALAYALGVRRVRAWPRARSFAFAAGLAVLLIALQSGVHTWGERLQSVHMLEHMLIALVAAPLIAAGAPLTLALRALRGSARRQLAGTLRRTAWLVNPVLGCAALAAAMLALHLTPLFELAARDPLVHDAEHVVLLAAALAFWMPLVGGVPGPAPAAAGRIAALLALMAPMGALGAVLLTAAPRFEHYERTAAAAGVSRAADERLAAVIMWLGGGLVLTFALLAVAAQALWEEERRMRRREAVAAR
jgi:cytochrome c oxidase assembly factor CtaG